MIFLQSLWEMVKMEQELLILNMKAFSLNVWKNWAVCLFLHISKEQVNSKIRTDTRRCIVKQRDLLQHQQQACTLQKNCYVKQKKKVFLSLIHISEPTRL